MTSNKKPAVTVESRIAFIRRHEDIARRAFEAIEDPENCHKTDAAANLIRTARRECGYSKFTSAIDIFATMLRTWSALESEKQKAEKVIAHNHPSGEKAATI